MRKAATASIGTRKRSRHNRHPKPPWWSSKMASLVGIQRFLTQYLTTLRRTTHKHSTLITNAEADITRTRRLLRATGRIAHRKHNDDYYTTISRTIHKNRSKPTSSNKPAWNRVQARRRATTSQTTIPSRMHVAGEPKPTTTRESALLWSKVWRDLSVHDVDNPSWW